MHILEIKNVSKIIGKAQVLTDVNIKIRSGVITGFVGDNGSGKTMLFRAISGLMSPTRGEILFDGKLMGKDINPRIGIIIENVSLFPDLTGFENLKLLADINRIIDDEQVKRTISSVGLDPESPKKFKKYSLGMKQRLLLAQAIMEEPDILLLDEPTNAIDKDGVKLVYDIIRQMAKKDIIVLISSHYSSDIVNLCDVTYEVLQGGVVIDKE